MAGKPPPSDHGTSSFWNKRQLRSTPDFRNCELRGRQIVIEGHTFESDDILIDPTVLRTISLLRIGLVVVRENRPISIRIPPRLVSQPTHTRRFWTKCTIHTSFRLSHLPRLQRSTSLTWTLSSSNSKININPHSHHLPREKGQQTEGAADGVQADNDNDPPAQGGAPGDGHGGNGGNASSVSLSDREHISSIAFRLPSLQLPKCSGTNTECIKTYFDEVESLGRIYKCMAGGSSAVHGFTWLER